MLSWAITSAPTPPARSPWRTATTHPDRQWRSGQHHRRHYAWSRHIISGNRAGGVEISESDANFVEGNYIGTNTAGTASLGNGNDGVLITDDALDNTIGGTTPGAGNIISGNSAYANGVEIIFSSNANFVEGNYIGTNARRHRIIGQRATSCLDQRQRRQHDRWHGCRRA